MFKGYNTNTISKLALFILVISFSNVIAAPFSNVPAYYGRAYERDDGSKKHDVNGGSYRIQNYDTTTPYKDDDGDGEKESYPLSEDEYENDSIEHYDGFRFPLREDDLIVQVIGEEDGQQYPRKRRNYHDDKDVLKECGRGKCLCGSSYGRKGYGDRYEYDEYKKDDCKEFGKGGRYTVAYDHAPRHCIKNGQQAHGIKGYEIDGFEQVDRSKNEGCEFDEYMNYSGGYYERKPSDRKFRNRRHEKNSPKPYQYKKTLGHWDEEYDFDDDYVVVDVGYRPTGHCDKHKRGQYAQIKPSEEVYEKKPYSVSEDVESSHNEACEDASRVHEGVGKKYKGSGGYGKPPAHWY